jgi:capsular polysaccharide biosynthesis protein
VKDKDRQVLPPLNDGADLPERLWLYDDFTPGEDPPVTDYAAGLASLAFIGAAVRRTRRFWCALAIVGLVGGFGMFAMSPPAYEASTTILLTHSVNADPASAIQTDMALAHSGRVAQAVISKLGMQETASSFLAAYKVLNLTDRVLQVTASAPSSNEAVRQANAVAAEFLQFRADDLEAQQQLTIAGLQQQISQARQNITSLNTQIAELSAQPASSGRQAALSQLATKRSDAESALNALQQTTNSDKASAAADVTAQVEGSTVLDPALAMHHSAAKFALTYAAIGLIVGLALGLAIVISRALVSDRLRRRDDIADALGVTVNLSVGRIGAPRWHLGRPGLTAARNHDMQRIVAHLRDAVPQSGPGAAALAVVPVDNERSAAQSLVALALACARQGQHVLLADLCPGAPAAHLLGARSPGVQKVSADGVSLAVAVGRREDVMPIGPVQPSRARAPHGGPDDVLAAAYGSADILLTLMALDPSLGAEHLRTWATDAVVIVTAGQSSWLRIHAVGELIRLARIRLVSAVLIGADKSDESLGITQTAAHGSGPARTRGL